MNRKKKERRMKLIEILFSVESFLQPKLLVLLKESNSYIWIFIKR